MPRDPDNNPTERFIRILQEVKELETYAAVAREIIEIVIPDRLPDLPPYPRMTAVIQERTRQHIMARHTIVHRRITNKATGHVREYKYTDDRTHSEWISDVHRKRAGQQNTRLRQADGIDLRAIEQKHRENPPVFLPNETPLGEPLENIPTLASILSTYMQGSHEQMEDEVEAMGIEAAKEKIKELNVLAEKVIALHLRSSMTDTQAWIRAAGEDAVALAVEQREREKKL